MMAAKITFTVLLTFCVTTLMSNALADDIPTPTSNSKISPALQRSLKRKPSVNIFISFLEGTDGVLAQINRGTYTNSGDKATALYEALNTHAAQTQENVLDLLHSSKFNLTKVQSLWITNQVYAQGANESVVEILAAMPEVRVLDEELIFHVRERERFEEPNVEAKQQEIQRTNWGPNKIKSEEAWIEGGNGDGAVVGLIDTGARVTHEAIRGSYRGDTRSWYNPYNQTTLPEDGNGHGTHSTGIIVGTQGLGVAPGAKWIACKGFQDDNSGLQHAILTCGQFMTCPYKYNGEESNCALKPDVVSNSWGGKPGLSFFDPVIKTWHAVNIIPVFSQGNNGPKCGSARAPGDSRADVIAVGATNSTDAIAEYSSRGPTINNSQKPDISAPGDQIVSAGHLSDTDRATRSGTSQATPHVAGIVALLRSLDKNADYATIKKILQDTTDRALSFSGETCNAISDSQFPNYTFGYGRVNALAAVRAAKKNALGN